ncbi:acetyl-CoA synthetase [Asanoa ishikariensis]|uniref:2-aminobenzoate-CoA ligase n=1 Tax=Asanoa ishikariensis TaxID=137265 RepID=A0A1H3TFQ3_9ACTN|nr:AMP-binding protein [Asanoa ishikariensis]GIF62568.1 acetyl-CoA synthetase [Asanoa ishikariensis]SDZ48718.1 2-aminobenzoate-CoA ligase [Asanoa ishikariensis]
MTWDYATALSPSAHVDTFCRDHLPPFTQWPEMLLDPAYPDRLNCAVELLAAAPDRRCLLTPSGETWTYGDLDRRSNRIATVLTRDFGLVPGNRVLLRGPNNLWLAACWFAVLKAGGVVVTTMPLLRPAELTAVASIAQVDLALCDARFVDDLRLAELGEAPVVTYDDLALDGGDEFTAVDTSADDVALLAFTSGTTGRPKATMHFHRDVLAIADTFSRHLVRPRPDDVFTGTPPLAFTFGLGGLLVFPLRAGAATLLIEKATPDQLADLIERHAATICFTAPTAYRAILRAGRLERLRSLRRAVSAGEHLPAATWQDFFDATGVRLIDGIGSTELLHVFISAADDAIRPGATGLEVPGFHAAVLDEAGEPVPRGTPGRLAVKGPTGCRYLRDPRQTAYVQNGWNFTGDTYVQDEDGYFHYLARRDDMIVSSGYNIAGPEVEEALTGHPAVDECCVVAAPDPQRGHIVKAYVVLRNGFEGSPSLVAELQEFTKRQIAPYKYPRAVEFIASLPRTSTGKVQRYVLRRQASATTDSA